MSAAGILQTVTYSGLAVSAIVVISVVRLHGHAWKEAGRRKWLWVLLPIVTYFVLLSIPLALWYYIAIRPSVARADASCIAARRSRRAGRMQSAAAVPSTSNSVGGFTMPEKVRCTSCDGGRTTCWICSGRGVQQMDYEGKTAPCFTCSGTGYTNCSSCGGTGYK
jgi:hypothetical protein